MLTRSSNIKSLYFSRSKKSLGKSFQRVWNSQRTPPICYHDHVINFIPGSVPPNIMPYRYPYLQKSEIQHMVSKMLDVGIIQPSQSSFSAPLVLVHKKDGSNGACVRIIGSSISSLIKINFPFLWLMNYWMNYMEKFIVPSWIFFQDITKLE